MNNFESCGDHDGGDCKSPLYRNKIWPNCPYNQAYIGNGECDQYMSKTKDCALDLADCIENSLNKKRADKNEWPWMAALYGYNNRKEKLYFLCGASLISEEYLLTAAECIKSSTRSQLKIQLGVYILDEYDGDEQTFDIAWMKIHEEYDSKNSENDIAILKLDRPVNFTDSIQPATLPKSDYSHDSNFLAIAVGWGSLYSGGPIPTKFLMEVEVYVWNNTHCANNYARKNGYVFDTQICAGFDSDGKLGGDVCNGDSGGPLNCPVFNQDSELSYYELCGISSWGKGCGEIEYPGVYTRVSKYLDWIEKNMKES